MPKTLRLHTLAKELGIPSKVIIEKCKAEGIELKNHMAAISLGLAESIREWFSTAGDVTSVEIAEHVDLEKIPKLKPKARKADSDSAIAVAEGPEDEAADKEAIETGPTADDDEVAEEPVEPRVKVIETPPAPAVQPAAKADIPSSAPASESIVVEQSVVQVEPPQVSQPPAPPAAEPPPVLRPAAKYEPPAILPSKPIEPIRPAGPQLVPKPAELRGPRVVRIEAPESVAPPRPRPPSAAPSGDLTGDRAGAAPRRGARGRGRPMTEEEMEAARRAARSPRRHGTSQDIAFERLREWRDQDLQERKERLASATGHGLRDRRAAEKRRQLTTPGGPAPSRRAAVEITVPIAMKEFCAAIGQGYTALLPKVIEHTGGPLTINQSINGELAELLALDFGVQIKIVQAQTVLEKIEARFRGRERTNLQSRPPIVTMLGHVDHGKTSLLDAIRRTSVAKGEAGGITQHIGAYRVDRGNWHVTFLDTPGHEAFTSMRARGANLTDVVVLVVAADDGVMPQTVEAINHAKAAGVPIVVALNKMDLTNVDLNRVYSQLSEQGLVPTEWGGETDVIKTSATTNMGIDELLAHLSTLSELLDLKADPTVPAMGVVIEARMREGQGVVALVMVREGTLEAGQTIVCGPGSGRIRSLTDDQGHRLKKALPATPVAVVGLDEMPDAGDKLYVAEDIGIAKQIATEIRHARREVALQSTIKPRGLEALLSAETASAVPELNIILKADVQGSLDAIRQKLAEFPADKARLSILHAGIGAISEADVRLAQASSAIVIGFTVAPEERARQLADQVGVEIRQYRIIYEVLEDLQKALAGMLEPVQKEEIRGRVEVRQTFNVSRLGTVAGCFVADGTVARSHKLRLIRNGRIVLERGTLTSLKRFKDDVREVKSGFECGLKITDYDDVKPGDVIETYEIVEIAQVL